jgi:putative ABC transport system substrate-binding protein
VGGEYGPLGRRHSGRGRAVPARCPSIVCCSSRGVYSIIALANRHGIPAIYPWHEHAVAGSLMSYGSDPSEDSRQVGLYAGRILKGANPADLPVWETVKVELILNFKTAKAQGVTFPLSLLARADEVIE